VEPHERIARRRHQGGQAREEFERRHDPVLGAAVALRLDAVRDTPVGQAPQTVERERRSRAVTTQALAPDVVVGGNRNTRVQVEAIVLDRALARGRPGDAFLLGRVPVFAQGARRAALHRNRRAGIEWRLRRSAGMFLRRRPSRCPLRASHATTRRRTRRTTSSSSSRVGGGAG